MTKETEEVYDTILTTDNFFELLGNLLLNMENGTIDNYPLEWLTNGKD